MTQNITIRTATSDDIGALDRVFQRSYTQLLAPDYPPSVLVTAVPVIGRAQPALVQSGLFYVAEIDGTLVGAGGWSLGPPGGRPGKRGEGHIRHVATDPAHVRKGVGRALLDHILLVARASGMAQMSCLSTRSARAFYADMGFHEQGDVIVPIGGVMEFPAIQMWRML
ncbi:GNAT family N-acetyltransferase [Cognatishimia sp. F0-27]|uniref:GNAT family N-acetyltransferase n=1 Tax=Cognatishimia sp. F0-27 TaxID=2816855 RepID=UPI001D0C2D7D|nr:GNAT family N-acetyltransferase [Cognatishimia sp. F0-27]MCC1495118.1 GNAT family N-acetyltransferase [Cognatishimia sp. F0-27]